jgi:pyruvate kinase
MKRRTKIVATLGPSSWDPDTIKQLIEVGVNVFRLNFSHGTHQEFAEVIQRVRTISIDLDVPICLLQDLQGPKIRIGEIQGGQVNLKSGQKLTLTVNPRLGDEEIIYVAFDELPRYVHADNRILLDDGRIELKVIGKTDEDIQTQVIVGGKLKSHQGVNLPGAKIKLVTLTEKDLADLAFGLTNQVDMIALSFVRSPEDIDNLRQEIIRLEPEIQDIPIIAKLERPEALEKLDAIIEVADGVMVARGDLGIEMSPESVPIAQKKIITAANRHAKIVITATQMLESMINNPRPTRAETTDVANAIFDGTDAVMLSGETAIGDFPVRSVETMHNIICQAEDNLSDWGHWDGNLGEEASSVETRGDVTHDDALSITRAAKELAHDRNVTAIAVFTQSGRTASLMAKSRPRVPILAFTPNKDTYKRMALFWGVIPHVVPYSDTVEAMLERVEETILDTTILLPGQQIVLISGFPVGAMCPPNLAILHTIRG